MWSRGQNCVYCSLNLFGNSHKATHSASYFDNPPPYPRRSRRGGALQCVLCVSYVDESDIRLVRSSQKKSLQGIKPTAVQPRKVGSCCSNMTPSLVHGIEPRVKFDIPHVHLAKLAICCLERVVLHNIYITL